MFFYVLLLNVIKLNRFHFDKSLLLLSSLIELCRGLGMWLKVFYLVHNISNFATRIQFTAARDEFLQNKALNVNLFCYINNERIFVTKDNPKRRFSQRFENVKQNNEKKIFLKHFRNYLNIHFCMREKEVK